MRWSKKADTVVLETTIFIVLNIVFFVVLLIFAYSSGKGAYVYEQTYAKQIALLIDNSKPDMTISLDMEKGIELARENKKQEDKIVIIDKEENKITVSLSGKGGYSFQYFSDYSIESQFSENYLVLKIGEKNE